MDYTVLCSQIIVQIFPNIAHTCENEKKWSNILLSKKQALTINLLTKRKLLWFAAR